MKPYIPEDDAERAEILLDSCLFGYFPNSCIAVAKHSFVNNEKHNPGTEPHWDRSKSTDHRNKILRHFMDADGSAQGIEHAKALVWRAHAYLEDLLIAAGATPGRNAIGSPDDKPDLAPSVCRDNDDWIPWNGGVMPVPRGTLVDVRHRDGDEFRRKPAGVRRS